MFIRGWRFTYLSPGTIGNASDPGQTRSFRVKGPRPCSVAPFLTSQLTPLRPSLGFRGATSSSQLFLPVILRYYWHCQPFCGAFRYCSSRGDKEPHAEISHQHGPRATARLEGEAVEERWQHLCHLGADFQSFCSAFTPAPAKPLEHTTVLTPSSGRCRVPYRVLSNGSALE